MTRALARLTTRALAMWAGLAPLAAPEAAAQDGGPSVEWGGRLHAHARLFPGATADEAPTAFLLRRARLEAAVAVWPGVTVYLEPELGENDVELTDGYAEWAPPGGGFVRVGRFKSPGVRESVASSNARWFAERAFPTALTPRRDLGLAAGWAGRHAAVEAGVFNGVPDGASEFGDADGYKDGAARVTVALPGGVSAGRGGARGTPESSGLADYETPSDRPLLTFDDGVRADGRRLRLAPDLAWEGRRLALRAEAALATHRVARPDGAHVHLAHRAWQVAGAWAWGGRPRVDGHTVDRPADAGGPGAVVVAARVHGLALDGEALVLAEPGSTRRATAVGVSAFWMPRRGSRLGATAEHVVADGLAAPTTLTLQAEVAF